MVEELGFGVEEEDVGMDGELTKESLASSTGRGRKGERDQPTVSRSKDGFGDDLNKAALTLLRSPTSCRSNTSSHSFPSMLVSRSFSWRYFAGSLRNPRTLHGQT